MSMKKVRWLSLLVVVGLSLIGVATAAPLPLPTADTFMNINDATGVTHGTEATLWVSKSGDINGNCVDTRTTYLKFSLVTVAPGQALLPTSQLVLTRSGAVGSSYTVGLYETTNVWSESSDRTGFPPVGNLIGSAVAFPTSNGATVTFTGQALATYVQAANVAPDDAVSFAVRLVSTGPCASGVQSLVLYSQDQSNALLAPSLSLFPTAVTLSTFHATDPAVNWPLIAGLGALAAVVIGGLAVSRRRAARG
jgi:hypothetical protein